MMAIPNKENKFTSCAHFKQNSYFFTAEKKIVLEIQNCLSPVSFLFAQLPRE